MIGQILKGYEIVDKIKDGSVGTVFRARNAQNKVFALKRISPSNAARRDKLRGFKREATLMRKLNHPNIVKVHGFFDARPLPFFVMEYFESENLKYSMWNLHDRVYGSEFRLLRQIAQALDHVHRQGIVHKDIKPENVLVSPEAEVRVIDFSLAQTRLDRLFQLGRRVEGTPLYMSPEQILGVRVDARSDIYSFGVLMYELLAKRPPFLGTTEQGLLQKHLKEPVPSMRTFVKTISPEIDGLCQRMLAKRREDRFPDMTAILYELSKWEKKDTGVRLRQVEVVRTKDSGSDAGR